jgi:hypothetical protein
MHKQNGLNLGRGFTSASGEQFNGFFRSEKKRSFQKDSLIDARARRVFDLMGRACEAGVYPFHRIGKPHGSLGTVRGSEDADAVLL